MNMNSEPNSPNSPLVLLAAGGTGGHVFPAESLASELSKRGFKLGLVTDKRGTAYGGTLGEMQTHHILAGGIAGKSIFARIKSVLALGLGCLQAWSLLRRLKPNVVVGFGGYASVPTMMAATLLGIPTLIHEQNALLGRANRLLAGRVNAIATSFENTRGINGSLYGIVKRTGMPVRVPIAEKADTPYPGDDDKFGILVLGGSQGAAILSTVIPEALSRLNPDMKGRLRVTQQCRAEDIEGVKKAYADSHIDAHLATFIDDVPDQLANAHLVISRAGSSSVAETLAVGRPSLLIPYPYAADDHQTFNAQAIDKAGAGWIMPQENFTAETLAARLDSFYSMPAILKKAARCAVQLGSVDAAENLADLVENLNLK